MNIQRRSLYFFRFNADLLCLISAVFLSLQLTGQASALTLPRLMLLIVFLILVWSMTTKTTNLYDDFRGKYFSYEAASALNNVVLLSISLIVVMYVINLHLARFFLAVFAFTAMNFLLIQKYLVRRTLIMLRKKGRNLRQILIIGAGETGLQFYEDLKNSIYGYRFVGFLDDKKDPRLNGEYLGKISELENLLSNNEIDEVVVALPGYASEKLETVVRTCERYTTRVKVIPDYFKYITNSYNISVIGRFPVIALREERLNEIHWRIFKRLLDLLISIPLFVLVFSWLWPLIVIAIKVDSPGKAFFKQERWGKNNKKFYAYKFRSMVCNAAVVSEEGKYIPTSKDDNRVTNVGRILRRYNLDELPQFINVLKGEMSIIGPRPHPTPLNLEAKNIVNHYMLRHLVKPGLTGWAQVKGFRGEASTPELMEKRVEHDLWYIDNWSYLLDIQIIFLTIWNMIKGDPHAY